MKKMFSDLSETLHTFSLGKINLPLFGKKMRKKLYTEKNPSSSFLMGNRRFFETTSEAKCPDKPRSGIAKLFYLND